MILFAVIQKSTNHEHEQSLLLKDNIIWCIIYSQHKKDIFLKKNIQKIEPYQCIIISIIH